MNLVNRALTQYAGYNFNSFARAGEILLAANEDGLYQLGGETDDGDDITAFAVLTLTNLGDYRVKRFIRAHIGLEADGETVITLSTDEAAGRPFTLQAPATSQLGKQQGT